MTNDPKIRNVGVDVNDGLSLGKNSDDPEIIQSDEPRVVETSPDNRYARFNILLGKGASKHVWKAIDREEGVEVAWNTFRTSHQEVNQFIHEIEILKKVRHPNIITLHDSWYRNGEFNFITELMTSGTLKEYFKKLERPNIRVIQKFCRQILRGLLYLHLHDPPIIHRDIKADNIFINGASGEVKIGDMGTAKMMSGKKYTLIGTPEFIAPEMYEDKGYSCKVDVYAFGMCLLEIITGEYPYSECKNAAQIFRKVSQGLKPDCINKVDDPEALELINNCLSPENERFTVQQCYDHIFLASEPQISLIEKSEDQKNLTFMAVFKGGDNVSVKFDFNTEKDTAHQVAREMIDERVIPAKFEQVITNEINRVLREERSKTSIPISPKDSENSRTYESDMLSLSHSSHPLTIDNLHTSGHTSSSDLPSAERKDHIPELDPQAVGLDRKSSTSSAYGTESHQAETFNIEVPKNYPDSCPIEELVYDTAMATKRGIIKAEAWLNNLKSQDFQTVGDLRALHEEDWASLNLTVFARRCLRNMLEQSVELGKRTL